MNGCARFRAIRAALFERDPAEKCRRVGALTDEAAGQALQHPADPAEQLRNAPGRPDQPRLLHPRDVPQRGLGSEAGRVALLHAVAHIEFNAINLALDAAVRFAGLPAAYYADWCSVAIDEARHFGLLRARLSELDHDYGDLPAHNGLWEMAEKTAHDSLARMALVPRVLEARGLDVTPGMITRLTQAGDERSADILRVILAEEVRHVRIGTHWFRWLCAQRRKEPDEAFAKLLAEHEVALRQPMNISARREAGFHDAELALAR